MRYITIEQENLLFELMKKCGFIVAQAHNEASVADTITEKSGTANFVTAFDVRVQNMLITEIKSVFPSAGFVAEEKENGAEDISEGLYFVIDPIDGTTNFIHDYKSSSISVGILYNGVPVFGAVYDPYKDELFSAYVGEGAFCNGKKISVSDRPLSLALVGFGTSPYYKDELADNAFALAKELFVACSDIRRGGSAAIDLCAVACGRMDAFFEQKLSPWDFMASYVIVTEAGGALLNFKGEPVSFACPDNIICTNAVSRDDVIKITSKYM